MKRKTVRVTKSLDAELYKLVKAYEDWIDASGDTDDADLISAVAEFCRMVRDVIPATAKSLERSGITPSNVGQAR